MARRARTEAPWIERCGERQRFLVAACDVVDDLVPSLEREVFGPLHARAMEIHAQLGGQVRRRFPSLSGLVSDGDDLHRPRSQAFDDIDWLAAKMLEPNHHMELWSASRAKLDGSPIRSNAHISSIASLEAVFAVEIEQASELRDWLAARHLPSDPMTGRWAFAFFRELLCLWAAHPESRGSLLPVPGPVDFVVGGFSFTPTVDEDAAGDVDAVVKRLEVEARAFFRRRYGSGIDSRPLDHLEMAALSIIAGRKQDAIASDYGVTPQAVSAAVAGVRSVLGLGTSQTS
jgi:hypothetical protein